MVRRIKSRSLLALKFEIGVSWDPEFSVNDLIAGDRVIMASDGLWDIMPNEEAAHLISYRSNSSKSSQSLLQIAREKYQKNRLRQGRADNTTIVCFFVQDEQATQTPPPPPFEKLKKKAMKRSRSNPSEENN